MIENYNNIVVNNEKRAFPEQEPWERSPWWHECVTNIVLLHCPSRFRRNP